MAAQSGRVRGDRFTGTFPSLKNQGANVSYEGTVQRDLCYFLEYDLSVRSYYTRPFGISVMSADGSQFTYTPDFLVVREICEELVMCVSAKTEDEVANRRKFGLIRKWADDQGYGFRVVTDEQLRAGCFLTNLRLLWRYCRLPLPPGLITRSISYLSHYTDGATFEELAAQLSGTQAPLTQAPLLYKLLFDHILCADLTQPLTPSTRVWISMGS